MITGSLGQTASVSVGAFAHLARRFTAADVLAFAKLSGDHNPIHLDEAFARSTPFGRCIVHGMLYSSLFSTMFATRIPGCIYVSQNLAFKAPVFVGDAVIAKCVVCGSVRCWKCAVQLLCVR
jgi:acyl dehydratase